MGKSRKSIGRRARLGWLLALFLLIVPAPVMAGVEWTLEAEGSADPVPEEGDSNERHVDLKSGLDAIDLEVRDSDGNESKGLDGSEWTGEPEQLRGVEWT